jgi:DNA-binding transcriptional MerR regulator
VSDVALEAGRPYLSIGEVLNVLKEEFPDVTVSKIRFLESEGLIEPERTSSGYRKFSEQDIERLRFILRLQRDQFLPLKVIRERLDELEASMADGGGQSTLSFDETTEPEDQGSPEPDAMTSLGTSVSLSLAEIGKAAGLDEDQIRDLESFGLLTPNRTEDGEPRYDEVDLEAARLSRELIALGLEPRHLRMFRSTADRWASLAEQMVLPLHKQRNPEARRQATERVRELVRIGNKLLQTMLREAVGPYA